MALLAFDDFDSPIGNLADTSIVDSVGGVTFSTSYGYNGANGAEAAGILVNEYIRTRLPSDPTTLFFGTRCRMAGSGTRSDNPWIRFYDSGGNKILEGRWNANNGTEITFYDQAGSSVGTTSGAALGPNTTTWAFFEIRLVVGTGANGTLDMRRDGQSVFSTTGRDFTAGNDDVSEIWLSGVDYIGEKPLYVNHVQANDNTGSYNNDWMGEILAEYVLPDGDGNQTDWTPDTGVTNYTQVDEDPRSDSDYVQAGTQGDIDLYTYAALASAADPIAVDVLPYLQLPDGGSRFIRGKTRISATNYDTSSIAVADSRGHTLRYEENPNATAAWTASAVDGAEFGYEVRDS